MLYDTIDFRLFQTRLVRQSHDCTMSTTLGKQISWLQFETICAWLLLIVMLCYILVYRDPRRNDINGISITCLVYHLLVDLSQVKPNKNDKRSRRPASFTWLTWTGSATYDVNLLLIRNPVQKMASENLQPPQKVSTKNALNLENCIHRFDPCLTGSLHYLTN